MNIETLREKLVDEREALKLSAQAENIPATECHLIGQRYMCERVIDWIDKVYSDEEEQ